MSYNSYLKKKIGSNPGLKDRILFESWLKELGMQISKLREQNGYRQKDLASKMHVSQSVIARVESGYNLTCSTLWKLADSFKVDLNIFGASKLLENIKFNSFIYKRENNNSLTIFVSGNTPSNQFSCTSNSCYQQPQITFNQSTNGKKRYTTERV